MDHSADNADIRLKAENITNLAILEDTASELFRGTLIHEAMQQDFIPIAAPEALASSQAAFNISTRGTVAKNSVSLTVSESLTFLFALHASNHHLPTVKSVLTHIWSWQWYVADQHHESPACRRILEVQWPIFKLEKLIEKVLEVLREEFPDKEGSEPPKALPKHHLDRLARASVGDPVEDAEALSSYTKMYYRFWPLLVKLVRLIVAEREIVDTSSMAKTSAMVEQEFRMEIDGRHAKAEEMRNRMAADAEDSRNARRQSLSLLSNSNRLLGGLKRRQKTQDRMLRFIMNLFATEYGMSAPVGDYDESDSNNSSVSEHDAPAGDTSHKK